ncbi:hypothetical protein GAYE_SCF06G2812 [Galdieria yellowstonensis]|uniref:Uncharacterized protein n=1 Tax=Galdieria yellowstonensis TaxID=3028027 RepID=A0AAV9IBS6_9RHOD|nr:hypothetical protein GAYE_SCF06G2812 [Galdieria yellowstonensis]
MVVRQVHWTQIFVSYSMKIDRKYANVWLEDVPNLALESSETEVSELLRDRVKVGREEFSVENTSMEVAASLLLSRKFGEDFPLKFFGSRLSMGLLRQGLITLWNTLVDEQNSEDVNVSSAATGLRKSIYVCLIAVLARHFGIPVQYIGNTGDLLRDLSKETLVASNFAAMLLFMNLKILDELSPFFTLEVLIMNIA